MNIMLNGRSQEVAADLSVATLLQELDLQPDRVAVEINLQILDRTAFSTRNLQEGDRVEIISFIGGG